MPGDDAAYPEDIISLSEEEHRRRLNDCLTMFSAAERARQQFEDRWIRYYKLYRSYVRRDPKNWRSSVFMPIAFYIVETVAPRVIAQLPDFTVDPVGPEDVEGAKTMESLLDWCSDRSDLFEQMVIAVKDSLMFGTGLLKTYHRQDIREVRQYTYQEQATTLPIAQPTMDPMTGQPITDMDGNPIMDEQETEVAAEPQQVSQLVPVTFYDGPAAIAVDPFDFWPAPEATSVEDARFVIHRTFKDMDYVMQQVVDGVYRFPENVDPENFATSDDPQFTKRLEAIGIDVSRDPSRRVVEIKEFWTDKEVMTMLNDSVVVRVQRNPFDHGEKPFVRIVDQLVPHEFWGIGEIEPIEGLQDVFNALVNTRIDNVKLAMNRMFAVNIDHIYDLRDLRVRPGGVIRVREPGLPVNQVFQQLDMGDVTASSFEETSQVQDMVERVSGVSGYQLGTDSASLNDTATGVNIITEQGNARFALKLRLAEIVGFRKLARHFGSILQQFFPAQQAVRLKGTEGAMAFQLLSPDSITGAFDYDVKTQSSAVTESVRKDQAMTLFQTLSGGVDEMGLPYINQRSLAEGVLDAFNIKDSGRYIIPQEQMMMQVMQQQMGMGGGMMPSEEPMGGSNAGVEAPMA